MKETKRGVTMNTNDFMESHGLRINILYAVLSYSDGLYHLHGPGIKRDDCWVHACYLNFEGPPCMFMKEV